MTFEQLEMKLVAESVAHWLFKHIHVQWNLTNMNTIGSVMVLGEKLIQVSQVVRWPYFRGSL